VQANVPRGNVPREEAPTTTGTAWSSTNLAGRDWANELWPPGRASEVPTTLTEPAEASTEGTQRGRARWREVLGVLVLSLALAVAVFHSAWELPLHRQVGGSGDANEYAWFLAWVPYALRHGMDPLISTYVNAPGGINLMWNTSVVLPSFLMSPVTMLCGAAFSYNVLVTAAPALSATFAYIAFRRWTGRMPALAGAAFFGFSPYMVSQSAGHLAQILIMSAPLMLILLDRLFVVQAGRAWWDGLLLGLLAWAQLLTGEEVLAMEAVTAVIAVVALCCVARRRVLTHFTYAWHGCLVATVVATVLSAPFLLVQYFGPNKVQDVHPPNAYVTDLLNFIVPTVITKFAPAAALRISAQFTGNGSEEGAYIGIPLVVLILIALLLARRRPITWVALATGVGAALLSMGPAVHIEGNSTNFNLPDDALQNLPFFHNLLPDRFASMMTLAVGLLIALGLDELRRRPRPAAVLGWAWAALGLAAVMPITNFPAATSPPYLAFTTGESCPTAAQRSTPQNPPVALLLPAVNEVNLLWQAESKFCFAMPSATGMTGTNKGDAKSTGVLFSLGTPDQPMPPETQSSRLEAAQEIADFGITEIVVAPESPTAPIWSPQGQAETVAWVEWLLGQAPAQSHDPYISYAWRNLPSANDISTGNIPSLSNIPSTDKTATAKPPTAKPPTAKPPTGRAPPTATTAKTAAAHT
jgi:hypothetical protein